MRNITTSAKDDHFNLAFRLALDFVPGFRILFDDPAARSMNLPDAYYGKGTKQKGSGTIPEMFNGPVLVFVFKLFAQRFPEKNETQLAEVIAGTIKPELKGLRREKDRQRLGKTLRNRLAKARRTSPE